LHFREQRAKTPATIELNPLLDNGFGLAVADDLGLKEDIRRAFLDALGWTLLAFLML